MTDEDKMQHANRMSLNPLDGVGVPFALSLMNPNPKSGRNKDGPWYRVTFEVDAQAFEQFQLARELAGMVIEGNMMVAAINMPLVPVTPAVVANWHARVEANEDLPPPPPPNELAQKLHRDGYFNNQKLWDAMAEARIFVTPAGHLFWIQTRPCLFDPAVNGRKYRAITTARNFYCGGQVCAHHVQTATLASGGGKGKGSRKVPDWYTVPLCHTHHSLWAHGSNNHSASRQDKELLVTIAVRIAAERAEECMKVRLDIDSLNELTEEKMALWISWVGTF